MHMRICCLLQLMVHVRVRADCHDVLGPTCNFNKQGDGRGGGKNLFGVKISTGSADECAKAAVARWKDGVIGATFAAG